jgi:hydrogenase expression/formation protein HypE
MDQTPDFSASCPVPIQDYPHVLLAHGGGGTLMQQLLDRMIVPAFRNPLLEQAHDGAALSVNKGRIAFTTDSFVVKPLFFPGGDIGSLAVYGTVNDLAMCGARPRWLSAGMILEEGLPMEMLWRVVQSMQRAAEEVGVEFVTGDTKVVDRGKGDQVFLNTSGIGELEHELAIQPASVRQGDAVIVSGDLGRHGMAIMSVREGLSFETPILSDCAPLWAPVCALLKAGIQVRCLRDLTRGGLSSGLNEIAQTGKVEIEIEEAIVPVTSEVRGGCELLGLDPLYVANEGRFVLFVPDSNAGHAMEVLRSQPVSAGAERIGTVLSGSAASPRVILRSQIGTRRILDRLSGEQLPRIC